MSIPLGPAERNDEWPRRSPICLNCKVASRRCDGNVRCQILNRFGLDDIRPVSTAIDTTKTLHWEKESTTDSAFMAKYQSMVASLKYLATTSRLGIAFTISMFGRYSSNPNQDHMNSVVRIIAYLKESPTLGLLFTVHLNAAFVRAYCERWVSCSHCLTSNSPLLLSTLLALFYPNYCSLALHVIMQSQHKWACRVEGAPFISTILYSFPNMLRGSCSLINPAYSFLFDNVCQDLQRSERTDNLAYG
jgi:hypothetical protein